MTEALRNWTTIPDYAAITPDQVSPVIEAIIRATEQGLNDLEAHGVASLSDALVLLPAIERLSDELDRIWNLVSHLMSVKNSPELREAHAAQQGAVVSLSNRIGQSTIIYQAAQHIRDSSGFTELSPAQQRTIDKLLHAAHHAGVALKGEALDRFNELSAEQAKTATEFSNHVLDSTKKWSLTVTDKEELIGLSDNVLAMMAQSAQVAGDEHASPEQGPWRITLDLPCFMPVMQHAQNRSLRERVYRAFIARASTNEDNNIPLLNKILIIKKEKSALLGYQHYADMSLSNKMAASVDDVLQLLEELEVAAKPAAQREHEELSLFAKEQGFDDELKQWDIAFWSERLREQRFSLSDEELRPYFPLPQVLQGMFDLVSKLFNITVRADDSGVQGWHEDVQYFRIYDQSSDEEIASFFLDPYSRPSEKRGGAWMNELVGRSSILAGDNKTVRIPIAYLICNQTPPVGDTPSLMSFREVETLFHEFGHGLQHMLTNVSDGAVAGINGIEWDAVELPSQFMENWCYHPPTLKGIAQHYQTGEIIPEHYIEKLIASREFRQGSTTMRQLCFGLLDMHLHTKHDPTTDDPLAAQAAVQKRTSVLPPLAEDHFLCSFGHIFSGGYAAGYYSYKWAEVLSADAFAAFEEAGLDDDTAVQKLGHSFRHTVLGLGGSVAPAEVFKAFRGRAPSTTALLRHCGLLAS